MLGNVRGKKAAGGNFQQNKKFRNNNCKGEDDGGERSFGEAKFALDDGNSQGGGEAQANHNITTRA